MVMQTQCSLEGGSAAGEDGQMGSEWLWTPDCWPVCLQFMSAPGCPWSTSCMQLSRVIAKGVTQPALQLLGHMHLAVPGP